jgi:hypothetical protein
MVYVVVEAKKRRSSISRRQALKIDDPSRHSQITNRIYPFAITLLFYKG